MQGRIGRSMFRATPPGAVCTGILSSVAAAMVIFAGGCDSALARREKLQSGYPLERAVAAADAARAGDQQSVHKLVDLLDDPDPGVRFFAIQALVKLTGNDYGYKYWQSEVERADAVERWREAVRQNRVLARSPGENEPAAEDPQKHAESKLENPNP